MISLLMALTVALLPKQHTGRRESLHQSSLHPVSFSTRLLGGFSPDGHPEPSTLTTDPQRAPSTIANATCDSEINGKSLSRTSAMQSTHDLLWRDRLFAEQPRSNYSYTTTPSEHLGHARVSRKLKAEGRQSRARLLFCTFY